MQHDRPVLVAVLADVRGVEPLGQHAVGLDRADLPGPPDRVGQMEFQLRGVEGAFAGQLFPAELLGGASGLGDRLAQDLLGLVPLGVGAEALLGPQRQLDLVFAEPEVAIDAVEQVAEGDDLVDQLVFAAEDVRVVLGELAHPQQPVQRAVRLVAVAAAELGHAQRQVAIGFDALLEHQDVRRAVHRLERHHAGVAADHRALRPRLAGLRRGPRTCSRCTCPSGRISPTG